MANAEEATDPDSWQVLVREVFAHEGWGFTDKSASVASDRPWQGLYGHRNNR